MLKRDSGFCSDHALARDELFRAYELWTAAYGALSWERYLDVISELRETGQWIKEVVRLELETLQLTRQTRASS